MSELFDLSVGDRVVLCCGHPWAGNAGVVAALETWCGRPAVRVDLDNGLAAGVLEPHEIRRVPA